MPNIELYAYLDDKILRNTKNLENKMTIQNGLWSGVKWYFVFK